VNWKYHVRNEEETNKLNLPCLKAQVNVEFEG